MDQHDRRRRLGLAALSGVAVVAWTASLVAASGATAASARLIDATGATVGWAKLTEDAAGRVHVNVQVEGLTPGHHGIHLHAIASCVAPAFTSAGGHHNPLGAQHGLDNPAGAHAGDLPNLDVNIVGRGRLQATTDRATLTAGPLSLFDANGSAIIIHAAEDDQLTDPTGNSGARVACGVIEVDG
jgi:Cu-Zn family superoxide dismutase